MTYRGWKIINFDMSSHGKSYQKYFSNAELTRLIWWIVIAIIFFK